jgi:hypothetical protein
MKTNPRLVLSRMYVDAQRLKAWADDSGSTKQQQLADFFVQALFRLCATDTFPLTNNMESDDNAEHKLP